MPRDISTAASASSIAGGRRSSTSLCARSTGPATRPSSTTPERLIHWGRKIGPSTAGVVDRILQSRQYPEQGYRSCLGLMRLARRYPVERVEAACTRALAVHTCSYRSVKSILETGLDRQSIEEAKAPEAHPMMHANVRGAAYYAEVGHDA